MIKGYIGLQYTKEIAQSAASIRVELMIKGYIGLQYTKEIAQSAASIRVKLMIKGYIGLLTLLVVKRNVRSPI